MLRFEKVAVKLHGNNRAHYEKMGYPYTKRGDVILVYPEQVPRNSDVKLPAVCEYCKENAPANASSYWQYKNGITEKYCCTKKECRVNHKEYIMLLSHMKHPDQMIHQKCANKGLNFICKVIKKGRMHAVCRCVKHYKEKPIVVAFSNLLSKSKKNHCEECYRLSRMGSGNPAFNPTISDEQRRKRGYFPGKKAWKKKLLESEENCCFICPSEKNLEGHHLLYSEDFELKRDPDNGVLLCRECHRGKNGFHSKYGKKMDFTPQNFLEFLVERNVKPEKINIIKERIKALEIKMSKKLIQVA